jgi:predicted nucleotidyltransferase
MPTLADIRGKRDEILRIAAEHGARDVRVFGSVVRGEASEGSDVDVLVHLDDHASLLDHIALMRELEGLLGCPVDVVSDEALHRTIRDRVLEEAVEL